MERRAVRVLFFCSLLLGLLWSDLGASAEERFVTGLLGPRSPDAGARTRLDRVMPGGGGLLSAMPPWGYRKPLLSERVDEILALLAFNAPNATDIVNIITQAYHYRIYRKTVFSKAGYDQLQKFVPGSTDKGRLDVLLRGLVEGEKYYVQSPGSSRAGVYWYAPGSSEGLWIELENQPLIGHPVVVAVKPVTADVIEAGLASGRLKRPLP